MNDLIYKVKNKFIDFWWDFKRFPDAIYNIIRWIPTIYSDHDWDYIFILKILLTKIKHVRQRTEKIQFYVGWENDVKWMKMCEYLLNYQINDSGLDDEEENKYVNYKNSYFYNKYIKDKIDLSDKETFKAWMYEVKEDKVNALLWKIISWKIACWWD
jgi:hypothetical protein